MNLHVVLKEVCAVKMANKKILLFGLTVFMLLLLINIVSAYTYEAIYEETEVREMVKDNKTILINITINIYTYNTTNIKHPLKKGLIVYYPDPNKSILSLNELKDLLRLYLTVPLNKTKINVSGEGNFSNVSFKNIIDKAENITIEIPKCVDETEFGECSINPPRYCYAGSLVERCERCGCPSMQVCQKLTGRCITPIVKTCSDGAAYGKCSTTKPKYCDKGMLYDKCDLCGCPTGRTCNKTTNSCSECPTTTSLGDIDGDGIEDTLTKTCIKEFGNISNNIITFISGSELRYYDINTDKIVNTGIVTDGGEPFISNNIIAFTTYEGTWGVNEDLNGDGDTSDYLLRYYDINTNKVVNTGVIASMHPTPISNNIIAFISGSELRYYDINTNKVVNIGFIEYHGYSAGYAISNNIIAFVEPIIGSELRYYDINTDKLVNTGVIGGFSPSISNNIITFISGSELRYYDINRDKVINTEVVAGSPIISNNIIAFTSRESSAREDLNGDGDTNDNVLRYYDINTDKVVNTGIAVYGYTSPISNNIILLREKFDGVLEYITLSKYKPEKPIDVMDIKCELDGCSERKPHYCDNGVLINNCQICGCPSERVCNSTTGSCYTPKCSDGTSYKSCSPTHPKYCDNDMFYDKCDLCGCPTGRTCNKTTNSCSGCPTTTSLGDIDGDGMEDTLTKTCIKEFGNISNNIIAFRTHESWHVNEDLNGDGDTNDEVLRYYDINTNKMVNTGIVIGAGEPFISNNIIAFTTHEGIIEKDLNGDGDTSDNVLRYYDINTGKVVNTGVIASLKPTPISNNIIAFISGSELRYYDINTDKVVNIGAIEYYRAGYAISNNIIAFTTYEGTIKKDLNGDGDTNDYLLRYYDINTNKVVNTGVIASVKHSPISNNIIAFISSSELRYYDINTNKVVNTGVIIGGSEPFISNNIIAFISSSELRYYDINTDKLVNTGIVVDGFTSPISNNIILLREKFDGVLEYITLSKYKPEKPIDVIDTKCEFTGCSERKPHYCDNGVLIDNCQICGCPSERVCNSTTGSCYTPKCSDETLYGKCSSTKPKYCDNGTLINKCDVCGCPFIRECQIDGNCVTPAPPPPPEGWDIQTVDSVYIEGRNSITTDTNGYPHISYTDKTNTNLKYAKWTGSSWNIQIVDDSFVGGIRPSMTLNVNDYPHISYYVDPSHELRYSKWDGSQWVGEVIEKGGLFPSLALDKKGAPHISHYERRNTRLKYVKWTGSSWDIQIVDTDLGYNGGHTSLDLDTTDYAHITYRNDNNGDIKYARWTGVSWSIDIIDNVGSGEAPYSASYTSIVLDANDNPHVSYYDLTNGDLKYALWTGSSWDIETVDSGGDVGLWVYLVLDKNDNPHISYYDNTNKNLKYAEWNGVTWNIQIIDANILYPSLALDSNSKVHIAYYDPINGDLKYAREINNRCSDRTLSGECSTTKPLYCENGTLIDKCDLCECPSGQACNSTTSSCYTPKCSDGAIYGSCSLIKPKYCDKGNLIDKCDICGCDSGYACQDDGSCIKMEGVVILNTLSDGSTKKDLVFDIAGNHTVYLKIPKKASIKNATMNLSGLAGYDRFETFTYVDNVECYYKYNTKYPISLAKSVRYYCGGHFGSNSISIINESTYSNPLLLEWGLSGAGYVPNTKKFCWKNVEPCDKCSETGYNCTGQYYYYQNYIDTHGIPTSPAGVVISEDWWYCWDRIEWGTRVTYSGYHFIDYTTTTPSFINNLFFDVRSDKDYELSYSGEFTTTETIPDFSSEINKYLNTCKADSEGNCLAPLVFHSDSVGTLQISNIKITYTEKGNPDNNPDTIIMGGSFANIWDFIKWMFLL